MMLVIPSWLDAEETVGTAGGSHGVDRRLDASVGAVLETDGHREAARHLAVGLRLGGARADGRPADQVGDVLGHDRVEHLGGCGKSEGGHVEEQLAGNRDPARDVTGVVEMGIVDESLPADGRARLLEIDPHHEEEAVGDLLRKGGEAARVIHRGNGIVDRAGADDHEQPGILAPEDAPAGLAVLRHLGENFSRGGQGPLHLVGETRR